MSCPVWPSKLCAREGDSTPCACQWCSRKQHTNNNPTLSSFAQGPSVVRKTHINADVTEWLISVCQATVTLSVFKQLIVYGNQSYNLLSNKQQTYSAPDIINHSQLGFAGVVKRGD